METSIDLYADEYADDYDGKDDNDSVEIIRDDNDSVEIIQDEQQGTEVENTETKEDDNDEEKRKVKPKRVIRNPRPKLNIDTLKTNKGLMCLEGYFKNKKFRGSGQEDEDLKTIMKTYEYWCHRLFPKFSFDDCISQLEKLGGKKNVQVFIKKIRMDMVLDEEQIVKSDNEEEVLQGTNQDQFDNLLTQSNADDSSGLTEEQINRIRINKERASHLRQERLQKQQEQVSANTRQEDFTEDVDSESMEGMVLPNSINSCIVENDLEEHVPEVGMTAE